MNQLDKNMSVWLVYLQRHVKLSEPQSKGLATTIKTEVHNLPITARSEILKLSDDFVKLSDRIQELSAFQEWMDTIDPMTASPIEIRAQVAIQNYYCFVYLGESCFRTIRPFLPSGSVTKKCCTFLINNPVRAFRNALAHANWRYKADKPALEFWARKGEGKDEPLTYFEVSSEQLNFWQALARCTGYAIFLSLKYQPEDSFWNELD